MLRTRDGLFQGQYRVASTRLQEWDYAAQGWYFITICTANRQCFFGQVLDGEVRLCGTGCAAQQYWAEIPCHFDHVELDAFTVMPNHVHGIVVLGNPDVETRHVASLHVSESNAFGPLRCRSLQSIIHAYKAAVTRWCRRNGHGEFRWQARFYDHIIRGERTLNAIRLYTADNPRKWEFDRCNPENPRYRGVQGRTSRNAVYRVCIPAAASKVSS